MRITTVWTRRGLMLSVGAVLLVLANSSAPLAQQSSSGAGVDPAAEAALPASVKSAGILRVATSLQWPPFDFKAEDGQPDGIDIRLVKAIAKKLGLTPEFTDVKFPTIVPGVSDGRFDIGVDQLAETPERRKIADFVRSYKCGLGLLVRQGTTGIDINHLCGHTLALTQGSSQVAVAQRISDECVKNGHKGIEFLFFPNSADTYLAVANGRGDGFLTDKAVGIYIAQHNNKLHMLPEILAGTESVAGIVIAKNNSELAKAVRLALVSLIRDGTYKQVLDQFGVADSGLTEAEVQASGTN
jgi:polar amino acid transport system substrate-binding protein